MNLISETDEPTITNESIVQDHEWLDPVSLNFVLNPETPYPINALPTVLRNAVST